MSNLKKIDLYITAKNIKFISTILIVFFGIEVVYSLVFNIMIKPNSFSPYIGFFINLSLFLLSSCSYFLSRNTLNHIENKEIINNVLIKRARWVSIPFILISAGFLILSFIFFMERVVAGIDIKAYDIFFIVKYGISLIFALYILELKKLLQEF
jgi:divalent metal cation (Fe/Co/Zn/Cd) transporter